MAGGNKRGLSSGCVLALVLGVLLGSCLSMPVGSFVWSVIQMNRQRDDFAAFDHIAPGTPVAGVVARAEALGFEREPGFGAPPDAGAAEELSFMKVVLPPFGRWFIFISHADGGVVSARTSTLD